MGSSRNAWYLWVMNTKPCCLLQGFCNSPPAEGREECLQDPGAGWWEGCRVRGGGLGSLKSTKNKRATIIIFERSWKTASRIEAPVRFQVASSSLSSPSLMPSMQWGLQKYLPNDGWVSQLINYGRDHSFKNYYESGVVLDFLVSLSNDLFLHISPRAVQIID